MSRSEPVKRASVILIALGFGAIMSLGAGANVSAPALADELSKGEKRQILANQNRAAAQARAQGALGYERVDRDARNRHMDFYALSAQIKALSRIIDQMAAEQVVSDITAPPTLPFSQGMGRPVASSGMKNAYGPEGPTEQAVKLLAQYQLLRNGNKRLKVGQISNQETFLTVDIVTIDGSLVEKYKIDKISGMWSPVREP